MKALINFKICDNAKECLGAAACPTKAMYFDEIKKTIAVDETKCVNCGACAQECPIGAILVANNEEQYQQYIKDIEDDPRRIKDLFIDRYGAASLSEFFLIETKDIEDKIKINNFIFLEVFDNETTACLLGSIPIKEITDNINGEVYYYKLERNDDKNDIIKKYEINKFPSLLIFKENKLIGKIEGYYAIDDKLIFKTKINKIINY